MSTNRAGSCWQTIWDWVRYYNTIPNILCYNITIYKLLYCNIWYYKIILSRQDRPGSGPGELLQRLLAVPGGVALLHAVLVAGSDQAMAAVHWTSGD